MAEQYLLCRAPDGSLLHVAHILGGGIELQGRVVSLEKYQKLLGKMTAVVDFSNLFFFFKTKYVI